VTTFAARIEVGPSGAAETAMRGLILAFAGGLALAGSATRRVERSPAGNVVLSAERPPKGLYKALCEFHPAISPRLGAVEAAGSANAPSVFSQPA
jgi:hypothetical protein